MQQIPSEALQNPMSEWWITEGAKVQKELIEELKAQCPAGAVFEQRDGCFGFWRVDLKND